MIVAIAGIVRDGYQALFRAMTGLSVLEPVEDLHSALARISSNIPDLIVFDTSLGSIDGGIILSTLKQSGFTGRCLAICLNASQERHLRNLGIDATVINGIQPAELAAAVKLLALDIRQSYK